MTYPDFLTAIIKYVKWLQFDYVKVPQQLGKDGLRYKLLHFFHEFSHVIYINDSMWFV